MYRAVIFEAVAEQDVTAWLNADLLRRVWRDLVLPAERRELWESKLPELAGDGAD
jgi:hypothetical protein